jgi:uncharacterized surface protein with fasciclin (FAS1) repeats
MFFNRIIRPTWMAVGLLTLSGFALTSCEEEKVDAKPAGPSIAEVVVNGAEFTLLEEALKKAELVTTFQANGTYTVFAPTDDAFRAAGIDKAFIDAAKKDDLVPILRYHVLSETVPSSKIATADNAEISTLNGRAFITKNANGVSVNGSRVTKADVEAWNGVIHVVDRVILPPSGDIVAVASANPNFSLLVEAVKKADLVTTLQGAGPFTVFAPTNAAFEALGAPYNTAAAIQGMNAAQTATLRNVLLYHVVGARVFSTNLKAGAVPTALTNRNLTIDLSNGVRVTGGTTANVANVTTNPVGRFNVKALNGVIHTIDRVLLPAQ